MPWAKRVKVRLFFLVSFATSPPWNRGVFFYTHFHLLIAVSRSEQTNIKMLCMWMCFRLCEFVSQWVHSPAKALNFKFILFMVFFLVAILYILHWIALQFVLEYSFDAIVINVRRLLIYGFVFPSPEKPTRRKLFYTYEQMGEGKRNGDMANNFRFWSFSILSSSHFLAFFYFACIFIDSVIKLLYFWILSYEFICVCSTLNRMKWLCSIRIIGSHTEWCHFSIGLGMCT